MAFAVSVLPSDGTHAPASILGGSHLGVSKYSKHQDEAIDLVRFLNNYESQKAGPLTALVRRP